SRLGGGGGFRIGVSGNGTRFISKSVIIRFYLTEQKEVIERSFLRTEEGRMVADQGVEGGGSAEMLPGLGEGIGVGAVLGGVGFVEQCLLDGGGAAKPPISASQLFDHAEFDAVAGADFLDIFVEDDEEVFAALAFEDHAIGEEAVADGVLGGAAFTGRSLWSPGKGTIASGCFFSSA